MMRKFRLRGVATALWLGFSLLFSACSSPRSRACSRLAELCSVDLAKEDRRDCVEAFDAASQETRLDLGESLVQCTSLANSCPAAVACTTELGTRLVTKLTDQFLDGFERGPAGDKTTRRRQRPQPAAGEERPAIRYISVAAQPLADFFSLYLSVSLAIEVPERPRGALYVTIKAQCGVHSATRDAFFHKMADAGNDRRVGTINLFRTGRLEGPVERCELTLSLPRDETPPARFCMQKETTTPGRCPGAPSAETEVRIGW